MPNLFLGLENAKPGNPDSMLGSSCILSVYILKGSKFRVCRWLAWATFRCETVPSRHFPFVLVKSLIYDIVLIFKRAKKSAEWQPWRGLFWIGFWNDALVRTTQILPSRLPVPPQHGGQSKLWLYKLRQPAVVHADNLPTHHPRLLGECLQHGTCNIYHTNMGPLRYTIQVCQRGSRRCIQICKCLNFCIIDQCMMYQKI